VLSSDRAFVTPAYDRVVLRIFRNVRQVPCMRV
jgi:hypothetical protein